MARGRMVSQSINLDPQFNCMSPNAQLMFLRTVPFLDRDGLILGNPTALWARVAPLMDEYQMLMPSIIDEWLASGLVMEYEDRKRIVLWFKGFRKNQIGMRYDREPESELPPPPGYQYGKDDFVFVGENEDCNGSAATFRQPSGNLPANGRKEDGKPENDNSTRVDFSGNLPATFRQVDGPIEVNRKEGKADSATSRRNPAYGFPSPSLNGEKQNADYYTSQAKAQGVDAPTFTRITNLVLDITGKRALADIELDDRWLNQGKQAALVLVKMGFPSTEGVQTVIDSWRNNDWRGKSAPTFAQLQEHASAMKAGTVQVKQADDTNTAHTISAAEMYANTQKRLPEYMRDA